MIFSIACIAPLPSYSKSCISCRHNAQCYLITLSCPWCEIASSYRGPKNPGQNEFQHTVGCCIAPNRSVGINDCLFTRRAHL
jgi:hypothetical protein